MKREPICFICSWNNSLLQFSMTNILYPSHNLNIIWPSCLKSLTSIFFFWDSSYAWLLTDHCCYRALAPVFLWTIMDKISQTSQNISFPLNHYGQNISRPSSALIRLGTTVCSHHCVQTIKHIWSTKITKGKI